MSRSGASKHPGSRLARLIIAAQGTRFPVRSCTPRMLLYAPRALPRGGNACTCCFQNGTSEKCRLYRFYYFLLHCFTRSLASRGETCRQRETAGSPFYSIPDLAPLDFRLWTVTSAFAFRGHLAEGAGSVSSRSVLGQSRNTRSSRIGAKWSYAVVMHLPVGVSSNFSMGEWG
jgi:hypothetical protein